MDAMIQEGGCDKEVRVTCGCDDNAANVFSMKVKMDLMMKVLVILIVQLCGKQCGGK